MLTDHLWTPRDNLKETPRTSADFSWFTDGPYLKDGHENMVLGGRSQLLLKSRRQHLYLQLSWPNRMSFVSLLELVP